MNRPFAAKTLALLFSAILTASAQTSAEKAKQILDQAVTALGGDRFLHMQSRVARGRIYAFFRDELSGLDVATIYVEYLSQKPSKGLALREREILGKKQDYSYLFLEDQAWDITYRGARPIEDESWQRYLRTTENDILYLLKVRRNEPGMTFDYIGSDVYLSTHVEVVEITDAHDQTVRVAFDHNTKLPVHQSFQWLDPVTREHNDEVTDFDKWRDAGGVMWPYTIERQRNGYKSYQMFASNVQVDQPVPPKTFALPPGAKILKKIE
ncbi:MAG: hypothetical protein JO091_04050 [Acidobacteriaceae bacterium]|nr:hypothetical protein [Acidobacteriaceae bacterium]